MIRRPHQPVPISRSVRCAGVVAVALAVSTLCVGEVATTSATRSVDWDRRIDAALLTTGRVDSIAGELNAVVEDGPAIMAAKVRVANELGDFDGAAALLETAARGQPTDVPLLLHWSEAQERAGHVADAKRTLASALAATTDRALSSDILLRLATLALDEGEADEGNALLIRAAGEPTSARRAGIVAFLYGRYAVAADFLRAANRQATPNDLGLIFLEGNAALKARRPDAAASAFGRALAQSQKPADRLYAQERMIAAARQAGTLSQVVDAWVADRQLPAERLLLLATTLRELGRTSGLIDWWRAASADPAQASAMSSRPLVNEVLGAARSAGRSKDVVDICRGMMALHPDDAEWLSATLSALLADGRQVEADALLQARIQSGDAADVERIGNLAASLGRDEATFMAARKLVAAGGKMAIAGHLLEAEIHQRNGEAMRVATELSAAAALVQEDSSGLASVVSALESAGLIAEAINLLEKAVAVRPTEESLDRLTSLLMRQKRSADAVPVLRTLMRTAASDAARAQAGQRLIDAVDDAGSLDTMIKELRVRLQSPTSTAQDVSLLADALVRQNDLAAAVELIKQNTLLSPSERLNRIAVLYLRAKKYDDAAGVLRELSDINPDDKIGTLQRLADVHLKRGRPDDASAVIREIERQVGAGPTSLALMGGVMDQLGRPGEAADLHRRAIALQPKDTEEWLLWSNGQSAAGNAPFARRRLQILCGEAGTDADFATGVDGLLNLSAPSAALRIARREAILRLSARPNAGILYQVVDDLSDELHDAGLAVRVVDASIAADADQRSQRLRDLLDLASRNRSIAAAVDAGRSLLALGDDFPPTLFLQLGEQLLVDGRDADASRAFSRATEGPDVDLINGRVAELYARYGRYAAALDALSPSADRRRTDAAFREEIARLDEIAGRTADAFDNYLAALTIRCREMTAATPERVRRPATASQGSTIVMPTARDATLETVVSGTILTARTPAQQQATIDLLQGVLGRLIAEASPDGGVPPDVATIAAMQRRAGFAFRLPQDADAADEHVLTRWPADADFKQRALAARVGDGLIRRAEQFAATHGIDPGPTVRAATDATTMPTTSPASIPPLEAVARLSSLIAQGRIEPARAILNALPRSDAFLVTERSPFRPPTVPVRRIVAAAAALDDPAASTDWTLFWLDGGARTARTDGDRAAHHTLLIRTAWPLLTDDGRQKLVLRLVDRIGDIKDQWARADASLNAMRCAAALDMALPDAPRVTIDALSTPGPTPTSRAADVVLATSAAGRAATLRLAIERVPADARLQLLLEIVARSPDAFSDEVRDTLTAAARAVPPGQLVQWRDWPVRAGDPAVLNALADAIVRTAVDQDAPSTGPDASALASAAMGFAAAGDVRRADETAAHAIEALLRPPSPASKPAPPTSRPSRATQQFQAPPPSRVMLLRTAVAAMSPAARTARLHTSPPDEQISPVRLRLLRATLLDAQGDRAGALDALRGAFASDSTDPDVTAAYLERLQVDGRWAEVVDAFGGIGPPPETLTRAVAATRRALSELFRWPEIRLAARPTEVIANMAAQAAAHDEAGLAASLRLVLQRSSPFYTPFPTLPGPGGLMPAYDANNQEPPVLFREAVNWPGTLDDMIFSLRLSPAENGQGVSDRPSWVATALSRAAASDGKVAKRLHDELAPAVAEHLLTRAQRQLVAELAVTPAVAVPQVWLDELWPAALADAGNVELRPLARALAARGDPDANAASAWAERTTARGSPLDRLDAATWTGRMVALCDNDPAMAERQLHVLRATGGAADAVASPAAALWARVAAERGDRWAFESRLDALLRAWARQWPARAADGSVDPSLPPDLSLALPAKDVNTASRRVWLDAVRQRLSSLAASQPSNTGVTRQLAALGTLALGDGDREVSDAFYRDASRTADAQGPGDHQLCVADLATALGNDEASLTRQVAQLENRCLPAVRMPNVLNALERRGNGVVASRLRDDAATYCRLPNLRGKPGDEPLSP